MPATESTWRNMTTMHRIFAVSGVILTLATIWMFYKDHARSWKGYQKQGVDNDVYMAELREAQFRTQQAEADVARLSAAEEAARELAVDKSLIDAFAAEVAAAGGKFPTRDAEAEDLRKAQEKADKQR